jgi:hypothetical protein
MRIDKAKLRSWRTQFAKRLRERGVEANATERAVRGVTKPQKRDGVFRAMERGASTHWRRRVAEVTKELRNGTLAVGGGRAELLTTRKDITRGYSNIKVALEQQGVGSWRNRWERLPSRCRRHGRRKSGLRSRYWSRRNVRCERAMSRRNWDSVTQALSRSEVSHRSHVAFVREQLRTARARSGRWFQI